MNATDFRSSNQNGAVVALEKILVTLNRMDERLRLIETNTKAFDEESTCIQRRTDEAVLVCVRVNISSVSDIDTVAQEFTCEFFLAATWDEPQLTEQFNPAAVDWSKHWDPRIYFANAVEIKSMHKKHKMIKMVNSPVPVVQLSYRVVGRFKTLFSLHNFPFDYQTLKIEISSKWSSSAVLFDRTPNIPCVLSNANFLGKEQWDLLDHVITRDSTSTDDPSKVSIITYSFYAFEFHIKRKYTYFLTNIVCLMLLISLLSFTTFFVNPDSIGDRLSVILTLLLTAVTFKFVVSQNLPPVSYLTVLDWYVLSSVIFIFSVAIENSIVARIQNKKYQSMVDKGAWSVSITVFVFLHIYFIIKVALILRKVERTLVYHQRCYQWKNGLLPVCEKLLSHALPKTFLSPSQPSIIVRGSAVEDQVSKEIIKTSSEVIPVQLDHGISIATGIDITPGFADQLGSSEQEYIPPSSNKSVRDTASYEPSQEERYKESFQSVAKIDDVKNRVRHHVTEDVVEDDCSNAKNDIRSIMSEEQNHPDSSMHKLISTSALMKSRSKIKHSMSSKNIIEESSMRAKNTSLAKNNSFPRLTQLEVKRKDGAPNTPRTAEKETKQNIGFVPKRSVSCSLLRSTKTGAKFGISNSSSLTTIREDQVVDFENRPSSSVSKSLPKTNTHEELAKDFHKGDDDEDDQDSSGSDLSDSEVTVPIPKTESDINASLFGGRKFMMNSGRPFA